MELENFRTDINNQIDSFYKLFKLNNGGYNEKENR